LSTNKLHDVNRPKEGAGGQGFTPPKGNERRESGSPSGAAKYFEGELGSNLGQIASDCKLLLATLIAICAGMWGFDRPKLHHNHTTESQAY